MKKLLARNNIKLYSTENEGKSSVVERWNRTKKKKRYGNISLQIIEKYNAMPGLTQTGGGAGCARLSRGAGSDRGGGR